MTKEMLRKSYLKLRKSLTKEDLEKNNELLLKHLKKFLNRYDLKHIGIFYPIQNEIDLRELALSHTVYYPIIKKDKLIFCEDSGKFVRAPFNTMVPAESKEVDHSVLEAVIVPGIVYDQQGYRLGYGKGYYDRFLSDYQGIKIGVCLSSFIIKTIPKNDHDIAVDVMMTENDIYRSDENV